MASERLVELAGLSFRVLAPERAQTLLVHGVAGPQAPADDAIAYDRRGYGGTEAPEGYAATTIEEQSEDAALLLDALGVDSVAVAGEDVGALIALDLAKRHPARVRALALHAPVVAEFVPDGASAAESLLSAAGAAAARADIAALTSWFVTRRELRAIAVPTQITVPAGAPAAVTASAQALAQLLPQARLVP